MSYILLLIAVIVAQTGPARTFGGAENEMAYDLLLRTDSSMLVAGYSQSWTTDAADAFVLHLEPDGALRRRISHGDARANYGFTLRPYRAGYILAGWSAQDAMEQPLLIRLDANAGAVRTLDVRTERSMRVTDVAVLPDGDLVLAGQRMHASDSLDAMVMRVDSLGHTKWERTIGGSGRDRGFYIDVNARGEIALVGLTTTAPAHAEDLLVVLLDSSGTVKWRRHLGGPGYQTGHRIFWSSNDELIVAGYGATLERRDNQMLFFRMNTDGSIRSTSEWGGDGDDRLMSLIPIDDGYIAVGYTTSFGARGWDAYVARLDRDARVMWQGTRGGAGDQTAYAAVLDNGRVAVVGHEEITSERKRDVALFYTNLDGAGLELQPHRDD